MLSDTIFNVLYVLTQTHIFEFGFTGTFVTSVFICTLSLVFQELIFKNRPLHFIFELLALQLVFSPAVAILFVLAEIQLEYNVNAQIAKNDESVNFWNRADKVQNVVRIHKSHDKWLIIIGVFLTWVQCCVFNIPA